MKFHLVLSDTEASGHTFRDWTSLPMDGVQVSLGKEDNGQQWSLMYFDYYFFLRDGTFGATNDPGPQLRAMGITEPIWLTDPQRFASLGFKYGLWIPTPKFEQRRDRAASLFPTL